MRSPLADDVRRVTDLGRRRARVWRETASLHAEGVAARARAHRLRQGMPPPAPAPAGRALVGGEGELWHDDDDRKRLLRRLDRDLAAFVADVRVHVESPDAPPSRRQWWTAEVRPTLDEWRTLYDGSMASWARRTATEWSTYEDWLDRIRDLRSGARAHGLVLSSPEPSDLPRTVYQRAASGCGSDGEAWWTLGRVALYTTVGILGVLTLG